MKFIVAIAGQFCCLAMASAQFTNATSNQNTMSAVAPPSAGVLNDWLRKESSAFDVWDIGGQVRARWDDKKYFAAPGQPGAVDFSKKGDANNSFLLMREKLHVGYTPAPWMSVYVEGRDSSTSGDDRNPNPEQDSADIHQAFVRLGGTKEFPVSLKIGRQELIYGDERLVGNSDWLNVPRTFDAAKLRYERNGSWIDAFVSRVILPDDNEFNESNDYDTFWGLYGSTRSLVPKFETQLYFFGRNVEKESPLAHGVGQPPFRTGATPRDVYTIGARVKSLPDALGNFDYSTEIAGQLGNFSTAGVRRDHEALAAIVNGGYTWKDAPGSPRVGLEYCFASGDRNSKDGTHETFDNLFPSNHKFYGYMDFVSLQNIHDARFTASAKPLKNLTVALDAHGFWLAETGDFFYQSNGGARSSGGYGMKSNAGNYAGSEVDLSASYVWKFATAQAGYGHFFVGDYISDSLGNKISRDADYVYLSVTLNF